MNEMKNKTKVFAWSGFAIACIVQLIYTGLCYNTISLFMKPILTEFSDISRTSYALTNTLMSTVCALIGIFFFGAVVKKLELRGTLVMGGVLMAVGFFVYSASNGLGMLFAAALIVGIAFAFVASSMTSSIINAWFAKNTAFLVGITLTVAGLGGTVFNPLVGSWIDSIGWRGAYQINAVVCIILAIIIFVVLKSRPEQYDMKALWHDKVEAAADADSSAEFGVPFKQGIKTSNFWFVMIMMFLMSVLVFSIMYTIATFVQDMGYDVTTAGLVTSVMFTINMIAPFIIGKVTDKIGIRWITIIGLGILIIALMILQSGPQLNLMYVVSAIIGLMLSIIRIGMPGFVNKIFGRKTFSSYIGIVVGISSLGIAAGQPILQSGYDLTGSYTSMFRIYIPFTVIAIICCYLATRKINLPDENSLESKTEN